MKCTHCGSAQAAVSLSYGGDHLCEGCFLRLFEKRVRKTVRQSRLISPNDVIAVGLSGGKDSAAAIHILAQLFGNIPKLDLFGVTVDMGVRGLGNEIVKVAKKQCDALGVEHRVFSLKKELGITIDDVMKRAGRRKRQPNACSWCGVLRRRVLNRRLRELGATKLATGHNLDDEIQSFWMNIIRSDFQRIARMGAFVGVVRGEKFVPRIKPLRDTPENEVLAYTRINNIPYTKTACPLRGETFRVTVKRMLDDLERKQPGSKFQQLASVDGMIPIMREQYKNAGEICTCTRCGEYASGKTCKTCAMLEELGLS